VSHRAWNYPDRRKSLLKGRHRRGLAKFDHLQTGPRHAACALKVAKFLSAGLPRPYKRCQGQWRRGRVPCDRPGVDKYRYRLCADRRKVLAAPRRRHQARRWNRRKSRRSCSKNADIENAHSARDPGKLLHSGVKSARTAPASLCTATSRKLPQAFG